MIKWLAGSEGHLPMRTVDAVWLRRERSSWGIARRNARIQP